MPSQAINNDNQAINNNNKKLFALGQSNGTGNQPSISAINAPTPPQMSSTSSKWG